MFRFAGPLVALLAGVGCGSVGEPLPPLLNIPQRVTDLSAVQRGGKIIVQFSVPKFSTEGAVIKKLGAIELRAGAVNPSVSDTEAWAVGARLLPGAVVEQGHVHYELPVRDWIGKDVAFGVKVYGANGRSIGWSNLAVVTVIPPLETPSDIRAEAVVNGVRLTWRGKGPSFRVFRRTGNEPNFGQLAEISESQWLDSSTEYGRTYFYRVQAVSSAGAGAAESELSEPVAITPQDRFPPAVPAGLTAVAGVGSIELAWERNTDPDLAGYRLYRATANGPFEKIADIDGAPNYSDRRIESGKRYQYAVSAVDKVGNESNQSPAVEAVAP